MTNFQTILNNRGLKGKKLAESAGVHPSVVYMQAKNGIKTIRVAKRYAAVLNCNPLELLEP